MIITGIPPWLFPQLPPSRFPNLGFDPAPGSVAAVDAAVAALKLVLRRIDEAELLLSSASPKDAWSGAGASECRAKLDTAAKDLARCRTGVEAVRRALAAWWVTLGKYQAQARRYELDAGAAYTIADHTRMHAALEAVRLKAKKLAEEHTRAADAVASVIRRTDPLPQAMLRDGKVLPPSSWPQPAENSGYGAWGVRDPDLDDRLTRLKWSLIALGAGARGYPNAGRHLQHYLDSSGEPLDVDVDQMLRDDHWFERNVADVLIDYLGYGFEDTGWKGWRDMALEKFHQGGQRPVRMPVETSWFHQKATGGDWWYAIGDFHYKITGVLDVTPSPGGTEPQLSLRYQVHVQDVYDWDKAQGWKSLKIHGIDPNETITMDTLGRLHQVGLAREYEMRGSSDVMTFDPDGDRHLHRASPTGDP